MNKFNLQIVMGLLGIIPVATGVLGHLVAGPGGEVRK
jgi:hypothetical protein